MIKIINNFIKVGLLGLPFSQIKMSDPLSAAISAAGSLLGGVTGAFAQSSANRTNLQIARENREWQSEESQKARDYQTLMWNLNNEYNSPANQRRLAEEGGYNPYLLSTQSLGSGSTAPSSPPLASAPDSARVAPVNPLMGVNEASTNFARFLELSQNAQQIESNTELQHMKMLDTLARMQIDIYKNGGQKMLDEFQSQYADVFESLNFKGSPAEKMLNYQITQFKADSEMSDLKSQIFGRFGYQQAERMMQVLQQQPDLIASQIAKNRSGANLDYAQAYRVGSEVAKNLAEAGFFNAQALQINTLLPYLRDQLVLQLGNLGMDFLDREAQFSLDEYVREWQHSDKAKAARKRTRGMQSDVNIIGAFMDGFLSKIPAGAWSAGFNSVKHGTSKGTFDITDETPPVLFNKIGF